MGQPGGGGGRPAEVDAVRSFERWKKKYTRRTKKLRLQRKERQRPEWQVEREGIARLVQRYPEVRRGRAGGAAGPGRGARGFAGWERVGLRGREGGPSPGVVCGGVCVCEGGCEEEEEEGGRGPGQGWGAPLVGRAVPLVVGGARR